MKNETIEDSALRSLFWKEEILQVLYWMHGEGMGTEVNLPQMLPFLNTSYQNLEYHLHKITKEGLLLTLDKDGTLHYKLSETGKKEGGRQFAEAFQGMQKTVALLWLLDCWFIRWVGHCLGCLEYFRSSRRTYMLMFYSLHLLL